MTAADEAWQPPFNALEVIDDTVPHSGVFNMALDEVLLQRIGANPVLRMYRWLERTVSFGYFEPVDPIRAAYPRWPLVRRWTGGGVVEHGRDTTYSLLVPRSHPFAGLPIADTYRLIHDAVARALAHVGWRAVVLVGQQDLPTGPATSACFAKPVQHDVWFDGRKVAGAAQRRTRHGLLHQGSIQAPPGLDGGYPAEILAHFLSAAPGGRGQTREPGKEEEIAAMDLSVTKYGTDGWLRRI